MQGQGGSPLGHGVGGGAQHYPADHGRYAPWSYTPVLVDREQVRRVIPLRTPNPTST